MKIKTKTRPYADVAAMKPQRHRVPGRPNMLLHTAVRIASIPELHKAHFTYTTERMEAVGKSPCLILMNHSSFIDLKIAFRLLYPRRFSIVCTSDGFVGKNLLMRQLGCIPTNKFVGDIKLIHDIRHSLHCNKTSVLMYPEASYSFDGCATPLPKMGRLLKMLNVPVVTIMTKGAFAYDPLYNCLQKRKVDVSAEMRCVLTPEEIREMSVGELDAMLSELFTFDNFAWQRENGVEIDEPFRADGLNRILFRCRDCGAEGQMEGSGTTLTCHACGKQWELDTLGGLRPLDEPDAEPLHIPDWYCWQREGIRAAVTDGSYRLETDVEIMMLVNYKSIYRVGEGHLTHTPDGFVLDGCDGQLHYEQAPLASYSLYADYYWYEIGDVICIGTNEQLYYCFPREKDVVARARIAAEEIYRIHLHRRAIERKEARERAKAAEQTPVT